MTKIDKKRAVKKTDYDKGAYKNFSDVWGDSHLSAVLRLEKVGHPAFKLNFTANGSAQHCLS